MIRASSFGRTGISIVSFCVLASSMAATAHPGQDSSKGSQAACFAQLKKLAGDWVRKDESGKDQVAIRYRVIAGGSALEETQLPGSPSEMISIYHMDGDSLVMTHYCMLGNQPHLKATAASTPSRIEFVCTGHGTNMHEADMHIHHATFMIKDSDHFSSRWGAAKDGKSAGEEMEFDLRRKA